MRKVLFLGLVTAAGLAVWRRVQDDRADRDLWAEVTDTIDGRPALDR